MSYVIQNSSAVVKGRHTAGSRFAKVSAALLIAGGMSIGVLFEDQREQLEAHEPVMQT